MTFNTTALLVLVIGCGLLNVTASAEQKLLDGSEIDRIAGTRGVLNAEENVYKVSIPRDDVKVSVDGVRMPPFMGLTSWAAFKPGMKQQAMVMGDIVLFQDEVNPAMSAAFEAGLAVTALHNHFFYDDPKVYFMHIGGEGSVVKLATGVRKVLDRVKEVRSATPEFANEAPDPANLSRRRTQHEKMHGKPTNRLRSQEPYRLGVVG